MKWIHTRPFLDPQLYNENPNQITEPLAKQWPNQERQQEKKASHCVDKDSRCEVWAEKGECKSNPEFMIGVKSSFEGTCLKSCGMCSCPPADVLCERKLEGVRRRLELQKSS